VEIICNACRWAEHEDCQGEQHVCFCPKCWDDEDRACSGDAHDQALELVALTVA
jgi:hypothetical protein